MHQSSPNMMTGTLVGTIFCLVPVLTSEEVLRTVLLAATGAGVSFIVSWILKRLFNDRDSNT